MNPLLLKIGVGILASVAILVYYLLPEKEARHTVRPWHGDGQIGEACCICYETMWNRRKLFTLPCKHIMHLDCLKEMLNTVTDRRCPMCRESFGSIVEATTIA